MLDQLQSVLTATLGKNSETRNRVLGDIKRFQAKENGDAEFAKAMADTGNVFLSMDAVFQTEQGSEGRSPDFADLKTTGVDLFGGGLSSFPKARSLIVSIPELQGKVEDSGLILYLPDLDGIYRYFPTVVGYQGHLLPNLSLQVSRYLLDDPNPVKLVNGRYVEVAGRKLPVLDNGFAFINYCGPRGTIPSFSASDILYDRVPHDELKGTVALIGATAAGLFDLRPTPFTKASPGVEINANILENIYSGNFIRLAPTLWKYLLILLMALVMWYLVPRWTPTQGMVWFLLVFVAYIVVACLAFASGHVIINMTYPLVSLLLTYLILTTYKFRTEVKHSRYMKQMFQSMVAPTVVEEILKLPEGIALGGEEKKLTVMFSDIRGFTTYSEKHGPSDVVEILNEYLTQMTNMIFQTEGTLDKYIGDAIMAFWGAPTAQQDHAYRACSTALGMVDLLENVLHPKWELEGKEKLEIGIGLNTGGMVVGFVGSESIKNYTLIGDAVNLGSRLEGTTKEYKVSIIISETTYEEVKADMLCRELDLIQVKGKTKPIRIYELVDHRLKGAGEKELRVRTFEAGLAHYRARRFDEASGEFKNCLQMDPKDGPAAIFLERCRILKQNPPPADWDGVFIMKTK
ncbi:MAG TPA: adenylate/guanylate cyclase domain-containing protein, partial [bacterium]|nr:adenylate/guanylate cyclase domain-containing protein [bacterium]